MRNNEWIFGLSAALAVGAVVAVACSTPLLVVEYDAAVAPDLTQVVPPPAIECGGLAGRMCPEGLQCFDQPGDRCSDGCGADCGGICVAATATPCGGFAGRICPAALRCLDDPADGCDPDCGGADCPGVCVTVADGSRPCTLGGQCAAAEYCARGMSACGFGGHCLPRPTGCPKNLDPVCSCEGRTYGNGCEAARAGENVARRGQC